MLLFDTFLSNRSTLFRNRITAIFSNILLLMIVSKTFLDSWTRFVLLSSIRTWSYSEVEAMKKMLLTESKHWNHFCLWVLCPPTSTNKNGTLKFLRINWIFPDHFTWTTFYFCLWCQFLSPQPLWWSFCRTKYPARWEHNQDLQSSPSYQRNIELSPQVETHFFSQKLPECLHHSKVCSIKSTKPLNKQIYI